MNLLIKVNELVYSYVTDDGECEEVLKNINIEIEKGDFVAVLGHNGSGKSTFAKHLNAILLPMGGKVYVGGIDTSDEDRLWDVRSTVGMVFQNPDNQIVASIVEEDVAFAPENLSVPPEEIRKRVDEALETVGMSEYKNHSPHMLSGGQKQRVAIAGIIAMKPDIIVMDEPTAMLDPIGRREVMQTIDELNTKYGITIVLITHNMDEAVKAKRVVVIDSGKLVIDGTPKEVFKNVELLRSIGLDVPQVTLLAYELKKQGFDIRDDVLTVDECTEEIYRLCQ
ncbi:MAG: energy-coupling factor transporter ATPase [Clostridia bacterium]|nr:energy-coupling factor transporter ATPase [Clostridia bacterium]